MNCNCDTVVTGITSVVWEICQWNIASQECCIIGVLLYLDHSQTIVDVISSCPGLQVSIPGLERALHHYTLEPSEKPFDLKSVPLSTAPLTEQKSGGYSLHLPIGSLLTASIV